MQTNETYKKEFEEALNRVNDASENLNNNLNNMTNKIINADDFKNYLLSLKNLNILNEKFKDAVLNYYGFKLDITGFEN
jgi:hypothetical protein